MAQTYLSRLLAEAAANEQRMAVLFGRLFEGARSDLLRFAQQDGTIPRGRTIEIQQAVSQRVTNMFLGRTVDGQRAPFQVMSNGTVLPLSPYMAALWTGVRAVIRLPVEQHAEIMNRRLTPELRATMLAARRDPFERVRDVTEQVFTPNPLARYDPPHLWVDPAGHRLSDRIWNTATNTRRSLDLFLDDQIASGRGALDISRDLEVFLQPGQALRRTRRPYGTDASFNAMRLARTEITRAHAQASEVSAAMNPFVEGIRVVLSRSHPKPDICDDAVAAGPWPKDQIPRQFQIPLHPHCLCHYAYELGNTNEILDLLQADMQRARAELIDLMGPLLIEGFLSLLLGSAAFELAGLEIV